MLELFGLARERAARPKLSADAATVLAALPGAADDVARAAGLDARAVAVALAELELGGLAHEGDGVYRGTQTD